MLPADPEFSSTPGITIVRSGDWLVALEDSVWARGRRLDVLSGLSAGTEVVAIYEDIGKGNHEFAHAVDGEIITAVTTFMPPSWSGTQRDRLRPLAEELGMGHEDGSPGSDYYDLGDLEILLLIAEVAFGLSLDEADLGSPLLKVPDEPADPTPRPRADAPSAPLVGSAHLRPHVQRLLDSGVTADAIAAQAPPALSTNAINVLLGEANFWVPGKIAEQYSQSRHLPQARRSLLRRVRQEGLSYALSVLWRWRAGARAARGEPARSTPATTVSSAKPPPQASTAQCQWPTSMSGARNMESTHGSVAYSKANPVAAFDGCSAQSRSLV